MLKRAAWCCLGLFCFNALDALASTRWTRWDAVTRQGYFVTLSMSSWLSSHWSQSPLDVGIHVLLGPIGSIPAGADDRSMDEFSRRAGPRSTLPFAAVGPALLPFAAVGPALLPTSAVGPANLPVEESSAKVSEESIAKLRDLFQYCPNNQLHRRQLLQSR